MKFKKMLIALNSNACGSANVKSNFGTNTNVPQHLCVPTLGYDENSISLVWNKPDNCSNVVDYYVYMDGKKLGRASENNAANSVAAPYINHFYAEDKEISTIKPPTTTSKLQIFRLINPTNFTVSIEQKTAPKFTNVVNVATLGAVGDGKTVNTEIIQKAIDDCAGTSKSADGCKVSIPADPSSSNSIYVTGSLFLKSHMTLEIEEGATLLGSTNSSDYPMIPSTNDTLRPYALLNTEFNKTFSDIRITGKGTVDGNGWTKSSSDTTDEIGNKLPNYAHGSDTTWQKLGILAKNQIQAAVDKLGGNATAHGVLFNQCTNSVFANVNSQTFDVNNGDGLEVVSSSNTLVYNSFFDNGDDCLNFACGQGKVTKDVKPVQFTWILNNFFRQGHGGVVVGSHTGAWVQDILAEDNVMFLTDNGFRLKSTPATGGGGRRFVFRDTAMREWNDSSLPYPETFQEYFIFDQLKLTNVKPVNISRLADSSFTNITITNWGNDSSPWNIDNPRMLTFENVDPMYGF
uniref:Uncharacterized protein n=1 Tax=Ditylenchus dipsaci TaxID=166011 RepID=A0A915ES79_9BILA